jgi:signal transduction histidine kinase
MAGAMIGQAGAATGVSLAALRALRALTAVRGAELGHHLAAAAAELLDAPVALVVRFDRRGGGMLAVDGCADRCETDQDGLATAVQERFPDLVRERHPWHGPAFADHERGPWPGLPDRHSFLAVPLRHGSAPYSSLCVVRPESRPLTASDEALLGELAAVGTSALEDAIALDDARRRNAALGHTVRNLKASLNVVRAVSAESELDRLLELIVQQALDLVPADSMVVMLAGPDGLKPAAAAGVEGRSARQVEDAEFVAQMTFRGEALGVLACFTEPGAATRLSPDDQALLASFADSAATAVSTARSVEESRLRRTVEAGEREREHWARELHDETLQSLVGLRLLLERAVTERGGQRVAAIELASRRVGEQAEHIRALIQQLRPTALRELGLMTALRSLVERVEDESGMAIDLEIDVIEWDDGEPVRLDAETEVAIYRVVQEALANAAKHAQPCRASVVLVERDGGLRLTVLDDGPGFDLGLATAGFGLIGMRERATLAHGAFSVFSSPGGGTTIQATLPVRRRAATPALALLRLVTEGP